MAAWPEPSIGHGLGELHEPRVAGGAEEQGLFLEVPAPGFIDADEDRIEFLAVEGLDDEPGGED
jgi:hypothetical protein